MQPLAVMSATHAETALALVLALASTTLTSLAYLREHDAVGGSADAVAAPPRAVAAPSAREPCVARRLRHGVRRICPVRDRSRSRAARARAERRRRRYRDPRCCLGAPHAPPADQTRALGRRRVGRRFAVPLPFAHRWRRSQRPRLARRDRAVARWHLCRRGARPHRRADACRGGGGRRDRRRPAVLGRRHLDQGGHGGR